MKSYGLYSTRLLCPWDSPRQEHWIGLPGPSQGHLPDLGTEPRLAFCKKHKVLSLDRERPKAKKKKTQKTKRDMINCGVCNNSYGKLSFNMSQQILHILVYLSHIINSLDSKFMYFTSVVRLCSMALLSLRKRCTSASLTRNAKEAE